MIPRETKSRSVNNVTNLDEVRKAKAAALTATDDAQASELQAKADSSNDDPHGNRTFDAEKVARIKAAIAAGEYKIDPARIADKFIEHDRNQ